MRLRTRLIAGNLIVLLIGMAVAAPLTWLAIERLYLETQSTNLQAQAQLAAAALRDFPDAQTAPYSQAVNVLPGIHTHVIDFPAPVGGTIAIGDPPDLAVRAGVGLDEVLARPEIASALRGQAATAVRWVTAGEGRRVLYAAAPVVTRDGTVNRLVYIASPLPLTGWNAFPNDIRLLLVGALLGATAIAALAGWWIAVRIARPLDTLAAAARLVADGDFNRAVEPDHRVAELHSLGTMFNQMTASLRRADEMKAAFIADVSHELRTPLTIIKGTVETLQDGAVDDLTVRDSFLRAIGAETERLIRLVTDLLMLTRAEAGMLTLELEPLRLADLARTRAARFAPLADQRGVRLSVAENEDIVECALADPHRITQVMDNLLTNALRHTPAGGQVIVTVASAGAYVRCNVVDTGCGIGEEHLARIFDRFYRADAARSRVQGGSGLGLAICRALVSAHGGRIEVESAVGRGTTATFCLPVADCR